MFLDVFFTQQDDTLSVSRHQASSFAKDVAGDFNAIHDIDAKRFCVPGDLLFSLVLNHYGLSQSMQFEFTNMVGDNTSLQFPEANNDEIVINDEKDKTYLTVKHSGEITNNEALITNLVHQYVAFSGQTFPFILVPLMHKNNVMINTSRPLVIYKNMSITLERLDISSPVLKLSNSMLNIQGKRGTASIEFDVIAQGEIVGHGNKTTVLSGLREYDQKSIDDLIYSYIHQKLAYQQ